MAFDLHLIFSGICIFVPTADGKTYVLMPGSESDCALGTVGRHPHVARAVWEKTSEPAPSANRSRFGVRAIEGREIDLTRIASRGKRRLRALPDEVFNLKTCADAQLRKETVRGRAKVPPVIESRIVLDSGCVTGMCVSSWHLGPNGPVAKMVNIVRWTIRGVKKKELRLTARLLRSSGTGAQPIVTLKPDKKTRALTVCFVHITPDELNDWLGDHPSGPAEPVPVPVEVPHFATYYCAFKTSRRTPVPWNPGPVPRKWVQREDCDKNFDKGSALGSATLHWLRGLEHTCMTGQAPPPLR